MHEPRIPYFFKKYEFDTDETKFCIYLNYIKQEIMPSKNIVINSRVAERFLHYVRFDTQSDANSNTTPSTRKQLNLGMDLVAELNRIGLSDVNMSENGYIMATLPSNSHKKIPVVGFIAHIDTSPDFSGKNVKPKIVPHYDGGNIILNKEENIILSPTDFPELLHYKGQTLITTDGTTLLGADDKAGIAEIITAVEYLIEHPEIEHGTVKIAFTPDEEIGRGAHQFDIKAFGADFAYTMDGSEIGEIEFENFNAAQAVVTIKGRNVHPGGAKDKLVNASLIAMEFNSMLPVAQRPEYTTNYEGFFHLTDLKGSVEEASLTYIIRDHDRSKFEHKKKMVEDIALFLNEKHGANRVEVSLKDQYYNMREKIEPVMHIVKIAERAIYEAGIKPLVRPIRGGTDGSILSYRGLPTPNIFAGGHNFHGKYEFVPVESMEKAVEVIYRIIQLVAGN